MYRHGDIPLYPIKKASGEKLDHSGSFILAEGEATGHHHRISVADPADMEIRQTAAGYILVLTSEGTLTHQEHGTLSIAPGIYSVGREREKDWFSGAVRRVID
jgi:hypothetical protein